VKCWRFLCYLFVLRVGIGEWQLFKAIGYVHIGRKAVVKKYTVMRYNHPILHVR